MGPLVPPEIMDILGLAALVFVLGLKHGLDPDHLVAIDGFTRSSRSRWCGLFFSLGHGVVVTLVGVGVALVASDWQPPQWLEYTGAWISIGAVIAAVGAAFALSFDTISHALVFSVTGASLAGWFFAAVLGVVFTLGMALTDAL